jgi:hypothetical protein
MITIKATNDLIYPVNHNTVLADREETLSGLDFVGKPRRS